MKKLLSLLILLSSLFAASQNKNIDRQIKGFVYHQKKPLSKVNIYIEGKNIGTTTSNKGYFSLKANTGDIIVFKYLGLKTVKIYIEDVTSILNINMKVISNELAEFSVKSKLKKKGVENLIFLGQANINIKSSGYAIKYLPGDKLNHGAINIFQAMRGKFSGMRIVGAPGNETVFLRGFSSNTPPLWDIDGLVTKNPPRFDPFIIEHIAVISSLSATTLYGNDAAGGVILVSTKADFRNKKLKNDIRKFYQNQDFYKNDATAFHEVKYGIPEYIKAFNTISSANEALAIYIEKSIAYKNKNSFHLNILNHFQEKYRDKKLILKVLSDFEKKSANNVEDLKTIAYKYQEINENEKAMKVYKKIAKLRPNHAQTFRDIANTFLEQEDYKNAWKIYKYYLKKGFIIEKNDIGDILNSEMIANYMKLKENKDFKEIFKISEYDKIVKSDIRLVFEWNTSEAEFELEFVNSNNQIHKEVNSLDENNELIINQKVRGYTSKEFMIEHFDNGDWLVNINYLGNKQYKPTTIKVTTYYNWGRPNQTKEIKVFNLKIENFKTQLIKLNREKFMDFASN
ncbi:carboxypeptidase-like regulatory domain-containing protein [uncultured Polaribacter sp.]|uniref:carboxypeptidase-like regulatory domain-containing protein n=1 Tax=uncultured Polaribacter sp. TaxID=174711 RepID=UPI00259B1D5D|nr:carboxypeptidase-like regulatory domain-containing protein [uncultured Polaribacter sp.]